MKLMGQSAGVFGESQRFLLQCTETLLPVCLLASHLVSKEAELDTEHGQAVGEVVLEVSGDSSALGVLGGHELCSQRLDTAPAGLDRRLRRDPIRDVGSERYSGASMRRAEVADSDFNWELRSALATSPQVHLFPHGPSDGVRREPAVQTSMALAIARRDRLSQLAADKVVQVVAKHLGGAGTRR